MARGSSQNKKSFGCWNIRTLVFLIGILFFTLQLAFLAINIYMYVDDPKEHVARFLDWFLDHGIKVPLCDENIILRPTASSTNSNQGPNAAPSFEENNSFSSIPTLNAPSGNFNNRECIIRVWEKFFFKDMVVFTQIIPSNKEGIQFKFIWSN